MLQLSEIVARYHVEEQADRLGPDCPFTHWRLYFKRLGAKLCKEKFLRFGENAEFRPGAYAIGCSNIEIGNRVVIRPQTMLFADMETGGSAIKIADEALIGSGVHIYVGNHAFEDPTTPIIDQGRIPSESVILERGCWIGANAILLPGVVIGANAVVGAGSVVTKSVAAATVVAGNPAKVIRTL